jgi:hypothetical protein
MAFIPALHNNESVFTDKDFHWFFAKLAFGRLICAV